MSIAIRDEKRRLEISELCAEARLARERRALIELGKLDRTIHYQIAADAKRFAELRKRLGSVGSNNKDPTSVIAERVTTAPLLAATHERLKQNLSLAHTLLQKSANLAKQVKGLEQQRNLIIDRGMRCERQHALCADGREQDEECSRRVAADSEGAFSVGHEMKQEQPAGFDCLHPSNLFQALSDRGLQSPRSVQHTQLPEKHTSSTTRAGQEGEPLSVIDNWHTDQQHGVELAYRTQNGKTLLLQVEREHTQTAIHISVESQQERRIMQHERQRLQRVLNDAGLRVKRLTIGIKNHESSRE